MRAASRAERFTVSWPRCQAAVTVNLLRRYGGALRHAEAYPALRARFLHLLTTKRTTPHVDDSVPSIVLSLSRYLYISLSLSGGGDSEPAKEVWGRVAACGRGVS